MEGTICATLILVSMWIAIAIIGYKNSNVGIILGFLGIFMTILSVLVIITN